MQEVRYKRRKALTNYDTPILDMIIPFRAHGHQSHHPLVQSKFLQIRTRYHRQQTEKMSPSCTIVVANEICIEQQHMNLYRDSTNRFKKRKDLVCSEWCNGSSQRRQVIADWGISPNSQAALLESVNFRHGSTREAESKPKC